MLYKVTPSIARVKIIEDNVRKVLDLIVAVRCFKMREIAEIVGTHQSSKEQSKKGNAVQMVDKVMVTFFSVIDKM